MDVTYVGNGLYEASFTPEKAGDLIVSVTMSNAYTDENFAVSTSVGMEFTISVAPFNQEYCDFVSMELSNAQSDLDSRQMT